MEHQHDAGCRQIAALLSDYLDAELPPAVCAEIREHIAGCPPCVEFVESLRKSISLCHDYHPPEQPRPLSEGTREQLLAAYRKALSSRTAS